MQTRPTIRAPSTAFLPHYVLDDAIHTRLRRIERLDQDAATFQPEGRAMLRAALSYNAYGTASMEGNPLSLDEVQSVLARGPTPEAMRTPDEREILNWAAFMEKLDDIALPTAVADVEAMHADLFEGVMRSGLGRIKDRENYIGRGDGTVIYIPTTPERAARELQDALDWYHATAEAPLVKAWLFHLEFEAVHPFLDGNGRLGRALLTLMLHQAGYAGIRHTLVDYSINLDRHAYYEALQQAQREPADLTPWLHYMSQLFEAAYADTVTRLRLGRDADLNPRQGQLASWLLRVCRGDRRVAFGDVHAAFPHVNRRTLQHDLRRLVDAGFLDLRGVKRGATYGVPRAHKAHPLRAD